MAWLIPTSSSTANANIDGFDGVYVGQNIQTGQLFTTVFGKKFVVDGTVATELVGIHIIPAAPTATSNASISIGSTGLVRSLGTSAITIEGLDCEIINDGTIIGASTHIGIIVRGQGTATEARIENNGLIQGGFLGIGRWQGSTEDLEIENNGTIRGGIGAFLGDSIAHDSVENNGLIIGRVELGSGDDFYQGFFGEVRGDVLGGAGTDFLMSGARGETMDGGADSDVLFGAGGNDFLSGGVGIAQDGLIGGEGADRLTGGPGADNFIFQAIAESRSTGRDTITDFSRPQRDVIDLKEIDANTKLAGNQAFSFISTKVFSGKAGELRIQKVGNDMHIQGDVNGDKKADLYIVSDIALNFVKADFIL